MAHTCSQCGGGGKGLRFLVYDDRGYEDPERPHKKVQSNYDYRHDSRSWKRGGGRRALRQYARHTSR